MEEVKNTIKNISDDISKKIKIIEEKTNKKIAFDLNFNHPSIKINNKKITFIMISGLHNYIDGMYEISKDL